MRVCETITSGNMSVGKQGVYFNFYHIPHHPKSLDDCKYFHPQSCSTTLDANCHATLVGKDIINYRNFEEIWDRDMNSSVCSTL